MLSEVLTVLSEDAASPLGALKIQGAILAEIDRAVTSLQKGLNSVTMLTQTALQQTRAKGYHQSRDAIEKNWHKMNQALFQLDSYLDWLKANNSDGQPKTEAWLRLLKGQLERLSGVNFAQVSLEGKMASEDTKLLFDAVDQIPNAEV